MALKGDANFTSQPIVLAGASPVDAKMMVALKSDLTSYATWQAPSGAVGGNANLMFNYFGMLVYVGSDTAENNGLYVLQKNETDEVLQANAYYSNSIFRKDLANVASTYASCWVKISQTDATIQEIKDAIDTKQSESISVSGLTGATVQAVLEDISARLAGAATGGNLEALGNRVTAVEGDVDTVSGKADANAEAIEAVAADVQTVSTAVDTVSGKADANAEAIEAVAADVQTVSTAVDGNSDLIAGLRTDVDAVSGVTVENSADIAEIQTALESIYTKDETDSAITSAIANAATLEFVVYNGTLAELLQTVGDPKKIYLVTNSGNANNAKDEYIYSEGKWELIGTTATDLTNYFTKEETQSAIDTTVNGVSAGLQSGVEANAAAIEEIKETTIPAVEADVDYVSGQVTTVAADVATVSGKADANAAAIEEINTVALTAITESIEEVAGEVDLVAADVEEVSGKADANAAGIKEIKETTIPAVEAKVDTVSGKADANAEAIAGLRTDVDTVSGKADVNASEIVAVKADVNAVSGSVIAFNERVDALEGEHDDINSRIEATEKDIEALEQADTLKANSDATNINAGLWKTALGIDTLEGTIADNTDAIEAVAADVQFVSGAVDTNTAEIAKKAAQTDFITLSGKVDANAAAIDTKASQAEFVTLSGKVDANAAAVATKASQADLNTVSALAEANAAAIATKADAAEVSSTYLKKSGDTSLEIGESEDALDQTLITPGKLTVSKLSYDYGDFSIEGSNFRAYGVEDFGFDYASGLYGSVVDTTIPEEPEGGHIATTGAIKTYVDDQVSAIKTSITTAYIYRGSDTYENIAAKTGAKPGDVWNSTTANGNIPAGTNYAWNGTSWDALGGEVDLSAYATTESVTTALNTAISGVEADINTVSEEVQAVAEGTSDKIAKVGWKAKLGFIESTEVSAYQAQVDWNATSGIQSIANKPEVYNCNDLVFYHEVEDGVYEESSSPFTVTKINNTIIADTYESAMVDGGKLIFSINNLPAEFKITFHYQCNRGYILNETIIMYGIIDHGIVQVQYEDCNEKYPVSYTSANGMIDKIIIDGSFNGHMKLIFERVGV